MLRSKASAPDSTEFRLRRASRQGSQRGVDPPRSGPLLLRTLDFARSDLTSLTTSSSPERTAGPSTSLRRRRLCALCTALHDDRTLLSAVKSRAPPPIAGRLAGPPDSDPFNHSYDQHRLHDRPQPTTRTHPMSALDGERSPKRQRLESYSPASPPLNADTKAFIPPNTPPPSVRMSPSWQAQSAQNQNQQGASGTFPTPPSTSGFHSHAAGRGAGSEGGGDSGRQTPLTDAESEQRKDSDGDAEMTDRLEGSEGDVSMADAEHRDTNHERKGSTDAASSSTPSAQPLYKLSTTRKYCFCTACDDAALY